MSEHVGYVVKINELNPHSNADRLQIATIFSQNVIVGLDCQVGDIGVFFPVDLQLSEEYCEQNNLVRKKDENGNNIGGYLDPDKRNIRAMRLRGEKSEGLFMPLESFAYTGVTKFEVGEKIEILNGHEICRKYIPRVPHRGPHNKVSKNRKRTVPIAPLFQEHVDTEQLVYNLNDFHCGDQIEITLKMHGTSGRTGYLPKFQKYKRSLLDIILRREGIPVYDWGYVTGTRRVVLNDFGDGGFYGSNSFRQPHADFFKGKLNKGETVYYEIVGFTDNGTPIMGEVSNSKISDKEFTKQYGKTTIFSYGCESPESKIFVYRMTMTNEDGYVVEYTPDFMRYRCEQMGVETVPMLWRGILDEPDDWTQEEYNPGYVVQQLAEEYYDGPDPVGKTHVREGVVVRIINRPKFCAYKHKNFSFKVLEGIAKDLAAEPDIEEAQDLIEEEEYVNI